MSKGYEISLDGGQGGDTIITADSIDEAMTYARDWARDGDWGDHDGTVWVAIRTEQVCPQCDVAGCDGACPECDATMECDSRSISIDPPAPECEDVDHDWQSPHGLVGGLEENPGVWGHGGGVIIAEVCSSCGSKRRTDTWATNPETGEQGLKSVSYSTATPG